MPDFSRSNRGLQQAAAFAQQLFFTNQRSQNLMKYLTERQAGTKESLRYASELRVGEAEKKFERELMKDDELTRLAVGMMQAGEGTPEYDRLLPIYQQRVKQVGADIFRTTRGQADPSAWSSILQYASKPSFIQNLAATEAGVYKHGITEAGKVIDRSQREQELDLSTAEAGGARTKDVIKRQREDVTWLMNYLKEQGVKTEEEVNIAALFGTTGKLRDPLSPEMQGKTLAGLVHLKGQLARGKVLDQTQSGWLEMVSNASGLRKRGGVPSMDTGFTTGETGGFEERATQEGEARIQEKLDQIDAYFIEKLTQAFVAKGFDLATARQMAMDMMKEISQPFAPTPGVAQPIE